MPPVINSPSHKQISYIVHLPQSSVIHQLTQEKLRWKGSFIKIPIVTFQQKTLSARKYRVGDCEREKKDCALCTLLF